MAARPAANAPRAMTNPKRRPSLSVFMSVVSPRQSSAKASESILSEGASQLSPLGLCARRRRQSVTCSYPTRQSSNAGRWHSGAHAGPAFTGFNRGRPGAAGGHRPGASKAFRGPVPVPASARNHRGRLRRARTSEVRGQRGSSRSDGSQRARRRHAVRGRAAGGRATDGRLRLGPAGNGLEPAEQDGHLGARTG